MDAIKREVDQLSENVWQSGHVRLKSYPTTMKLNARFADVGDSLLGAE